MLRLLAAAAVGPLAPLAGSAAGAPPAVPIVLVSKVDPAPPGGTQRITIRTVQGAACTAVLTAATAYAQPVPWHQVVADARGLATWVEPINRLVGQRTLVITCTRGGAVGRLAATYAVGPPGGTSGPAFCETDPAIIPAGSIGRLMLGMPAQNARILLDAGGVAPQIRGGRPPALRDIQYRAGPNAGVGYLAKDTRVQVISLLYNTVQAGCATPEGIQPGSLSADVARAYGAAPMTYTLPPPAHARALIYNDRGIAFVVAPMRGADRVVIIQVFRPGTYCQFFPAACAR